MRSTDYELKEIMKRAEDVREEKASQKASIPYALSACACIALLIVTSLKLNDLSAKSMTGANGHYGSLLLGTSYMGYVVIGVLSFLLGVFVTLFFMNITRSREWRHGNS